MPLPKARTQGVMITRHLPPVISDFLAYVVGSMNNCSVATF